MSRPAVPSPSRGRGSRPKGMAAVLRLVGTVAVVVGLNAGPVQAHAQHHGAHLPGGSTTIYGQPGSPILLEPPPALVPQLNPSPAPYGEPVEDRMIFWHVLFNQLEGRTNGSDTEFRWDGEGWVGTDYHRLWVKSEGYVNEQGHVEDGLHDVLYARPVRFLRYFDWQAGHVAGRINGSYDLLVTNRLIAQPQIEMNFYSKDDPARGVGRGLAEIDTGLRLRYEFSRKFAPYIGVAYDGAFGDTATFVRREGGIVNDVRFVFGLRVWY